MNIRELANLLVERIEKTGYGLLDITSDTGFKDITDVVYCRECNQFHIMMQDKKHPTT